MEDAREARRKKLMNRGTDRLAFITGESRSLPPSLHQPVPPSPAAAASLPEENATGAAATTQNQSSDQISGSKAESDAGKEALPLSSPPPKTGIRSEISQCERNNESARNTSLRFFTLKQISSSISGSEDIRLLCSLVIAFLVVLLHHARALSVNFRPLLLLLLTDLTVVFGRVLLNQGEETRSRGPDVADDSAVSIGRLLEAAILFQKAGGAFLMDCSICAVIIICGIVV